MIRIKTTDYLKQKKHMDVLSEKMISPEKNPDELYNGAELNKNIKLALMNINHDYRQIIILKHFQDCSYKEIAFILNIPEKTVKSRLFTARQLLKDMLLKKGMISND